MGYTLTSRFNNQATLSVVMRALSRPTQREVNKVRFL